MASGGAPTIKEVAKLADVSVGTVSKVLNGTGSISAVVRKRVEDAAQSLGYAPHPSARSLRSGDTKMLGLLVADLSNPFFLQLVEAIEQRASAKGYSVLLYNSNEEPLREKRNLQALAAQRVDGVFVIPTFDPWPGRVVAFSALPCPIVQLDRILEGFDAPSVAIDNRMAGRLAAQHFIDLGHRRIAALTGSTEYQIARHRVEGLRTTMAANGLSFDETLLVQKLHTIDDAAAATFDVMGRKNPPTAIFSGNNHLTLGLLKGLSELELSMPDDVSIAVIDELPWAGMLAGGITTVVQPCGALADAALASILGDIAGSKVGEPRTSGATILQPDLKVRRSTGPVGNR